MDDRQHGHAPEHYFPTIDETDETPNPHDVAMAAASGEIRHDLFPLPVYMPVTGDAHAHTHAGEPGPYFYPASASTDPMVTTVPTYGFHQIPGAAPAGFTAHDSWQQVAHHMPFSHHPATETGPSDILPDVFGYLPYDDEQQQQQQQHGFQPGTFPSSFDGSYVAPTDIEQPMPYVHEWNAPGVQPTEHNTAPSYPQPGHGSTSMSPIETGSGAHTPSSLTSTSSAGPYSSMYAGTANIDSQVVATVGSEIPFAPSSGAGESTPVAKKGKARQKAKQQGGRPGGKTGTKTAPPAMISSSSGESSLSGTAASSSHGSQSSGRTTHPPMARTAERRPRRSHNLVEMQYRERLNEQFDMLRGALPSSSERLRASGSGSGGGSEARPGAGVTERRPSKGDVLEMAWQHIQELEQRRDSLRRENVELESTSQRLQQIYASQPLSQTRAGELQPVPDDDEDEEEDDEET